MSDFKENIKTMIREVLTQDLGIQNADIKDTVWSMVERRMEQKIAEAIERKLNEETLDGAVTKAVEKIISARMKSDNWPFKNQLSEMMKEAAGRVVFDVSVTPRKKSKP